MRTERERGRIRPGEQSCEGYCRGSGRAQGLLEEDKNGGGLVAGLLRFENKVVSIKDRPVMGG